MRRFLFILLTNTLIGVAVLTAIMWARKTRAPGTDMSMGVYLSSLDARYTLSAEVGQLTLWGPPPRIAPRSLDAATAEARRAPWWDADDTAAIAEIKPITLTPQQFAIAIRNSDVVWQIERPANSFPDLHVRPHFSPRGRKDSPPCILAPREPSTPFDHDPGYPQWRWPPYSIDEMARPLLGAMEDPDRWISAHAAARRIIRRTIVPRRRFSALPEEFKFLEDDNHFEMKVDGLQADLRTFGPEWGFSHSSHGDDFRVQECYAVIDPAQQAELIRQWHRRMDVKSPRLRTGR